MKWSYQRFSQTNQMRPSKRLWCREWSRWINNFLCWELKENRVEIFLNHFFWSFFCCVQVSILQLCFQLCLHLYFIAVYFYIWPCQNVSFIRMGILVSLNLVVTKRSHILKQTWSWKMQVCLSMCDLFVTTKHLSLKGTPADI